MLKKRGPATEWKTIMLCKNKEEIDGWLAEHGKDYCYDYAEEGIKAATDVYVCHNSKKKRKGKFNCKARMRVRYSKDLSSSLIQTTGLHDHKRLKDNGLSTPVKEKIQALDEPNIRMTARQIQRALQDDPMMKKAKLSLPSLRQVQNQKTELGRKRGYSNTMTHDDVKKYYEENKEITEDEDRPYAVAFYFENITVRGEDKVERPSVKFILVMSTLRLVRRQAFSMVLQADGTYKLMTLNYPLLVAGFSDADKVFFPTFTAISSHEDTWAYIKFFGAIESADPARHYTPSLLVADGATAITAGCRAVWPNVKRGMCYAHVMMNFNKELPKSKIHENAVEEIKDDVAVLAQATNIYEFAAAARTLSRHWAAKWSEIDRLWTACLKFFQSWLLRDDYRGWTYRHATGFGMPSITTNNGLEGTNKMIKDDYTHHKCLGLSRFILLVAQLVRGWSKDPERQSSSNAHYSKKSKSNMRKAMEKLQQAKQDEDPQFKFSSWNRYKTLRSSFYQLDRSPVYPGIIRCSCPEGIKDEHCKHSLLLMEKENLIEPLARPLEGRRTPVRKKKVGRALELLSSY